MSEKRKTSDYVKAVSERTGIPEDLVRKILHHGATSLCRVMFRGADIRMTGTGHIYTEKPKKRKDDKENREHRDPTAGS